MLNLKNLDFKIFWILLVLNIFHSTTPICAQQRLSTNGGVFTPKGDLKVLIVPVIFKDNPISNPNFTNSDHKLEGWNFLNGSKLPDDVNTNTGLFPRWLYNKAEDFELYKDSTFFNDSKLFYKESNGEFRFMADLFKNSEGIPTVIEIDPDGGRDWSHMNKKALEEMKRINPNFDWSSFDKRKNSPNYYFDNSVQQVPDKKVDYIVFMYRYSPNWSVHPSLGMNRWVGSGGGFASPSGIFLEDYNGYKFSEGFTMMWGSGVFVHELAHTLFNAPHLWGTNGTVGNFFYRPTIGWGSTATIPIFRCFNAWERWYMGFSEIKYDIKGSEDIKDQNVFNLNDFLESGDFMRIEIPFSGGQHLWIENHRSEDPYNYHVWKDYIIGNDTITNTPKGVYVYIEDVSGSRSEIINALSKSCNGLKPLNANGNFDYSYSKLNVQKNAWGNNLYQFKIEQANPISGINPYIFFRDDFNSDGKIDFNEDYNSAKNEGEQIIAQELPDGSIKNLYHSFGVFNAEKESDYFRSPAFQSGDVLGMSTNPPLLNYPRYDQKNSKLNPYYLNGLKISFLEGEGMNSIKVKVEYDQNTITSNLRWTGNIVLPNISAGSKEDLIISNGKTIRLDKSETVNRHTKTEKGDFINPSIFTIEDAATIRLKKNSRIIVQNGSILEFKPGSVVIMEKKSKIIVDKNSKLVIDKALIQKHKKSKIELLK